MIMVEFCFFYTIKGVSMGKTTGESINGRLGRLADYNQSSDVKSTDCCPNRLLEKCKDKQPTEGRKTWNGK